MAAVPTLTRNTGRGTAPRAPCFSGTASTSSRRRWTPAGRPVRSTSSRPRQPSSTCASTVTSELSQPARSRASKTRRRTRSSSARATVSAAGRPRRNRQAPATRTHTVSGSTREAVRDACSTRRGQLPQPPPARPAGRGTAERRPGRERALSEHLHEPTHAPTGLGGAPRPGTLPGSRCHRTRCHPAVGRAGARFVEPPRHGDPLADAAREVRILVRCLGARVDQARRPHTSMLGADTRT